MKTTIIHPMLVHFPIALLLVGAVFTVLAVVLKNNKIAANVKLYACWTMAMGALSSIAAIISGFVFTNEMVGIMGILRQTHITLAILSVCVGCTAAILFLLDVYGKRPIKALPYIVVLLSLTTAALIAATGHYGGMMVFGV